MLKRLYGGCGWIATAIATALVGCGGGDDDGSEGSRFVQSWGTAAVSAPISGGQAGVGVPAAAIPFFPSTANQTTGITAPGVAVAPAIAPPANTTTTHGV